MIELERMSKQEKNRMPLNFNCSTETWHGAGGVLLLHVTSSLPTFCLLSRTMFGITASWRVMDCRRGYSNLQLEQR